MFPHHRQWRDKDFVFVYFWPLTAVIYWHQSDEQLTVKFPVYLKPFRYLSIWPLDLSLTMGCHLVISHHFLDVIYNVECSVSFYINRWGFRPFSEQSSENKKLSVWLDSVKTWRMAQLNNLLGTIFIPFFLLFFLASCRTSNSFDADLQEQIQQIRGNYVRLFLGQLHFPINPEQ